MQTFPYKPCVSEYVQKAHRAVERFFMESETYDRL